MTGRGYDAFVNMVLFMAFAASTGIGIVVGLIAWIFTSGLTAFCIGAMVPAALFLYLLFQVVKGLLS